MVRAGRPRRMRVRVVPVARGETRAAVLPRVEDQVAVPVGARKVALGA